MSDFYFGTMKGKQGRLENRDKVNDPYPPTLTANRLRHASGPIHTNPTVTCIDLGSISKMLNAGF